MLTAGIDIGAKTIKVVLVRDGQVVSSAIAQGGLEQKAVAEQLLAEAAKKAGVKVSDIERIVATGAGRKEAPGASKDVTEVTAAARGAIHFSPKVKTVIEVGAEEGRGVRCDEKGRVIDFVVNEKCAAGAGSFIEAMARALELKLEEMGPLSLQSSRTIPMNAQCAVFAESEVVSLVHSKTSKPDISRAIHDSIASRIVSMVRRVGVEDQVALIGGMAKNPGFIESMKRGLETDVFVPAEPEFVSAVGAALIAADNGK